MSRLLGALGALLIAAGLVLFGLQYYRRAPAPAPPPKLDMAELSASLPTDPAVTSGTYANGLRYYVRANPAPKNRAELRLVVNAGSILEEDDQRGVAHFVEHMAFNGTAHFPKQAIAQFLESIGMRFGPNINATTTFDETTYSLQVPVDRPEVLDRALLIMEDWARAVTFDPAEVDKERGVIIEEWRQRQGAGARLANQQFPVL
ncbi:MAG TPA: insulinase family protein, partial [Vicinamibacterales bacterium]|nr:insulinase family protein [Vicinamibacterales bacterium]